MKYLFILSIALLLTSCKKEQTIVIQANDLGTGEGTAYANMPFSVIQSLPGGGKIKTVHEGILDDNGYASFDLKMHRNWVYVLSVSQPDNICYGGAVIHYLDNESSNLVNFKYAHCAHLKFILNNTNCLGAEDEITYERMWVTGNENDGMNTYIGCDLYEGDYFEVPEGEYRYDWEVTKNSVTTEHSQSFTLNTGDSLVFQIDY